MKGILAFAIGVCGLWLGQAAAAPISFETIDAGASYESYPDATQFVQWLVHPPEPGSDPTHPPDPGLPLATLTMTLTNAYQPPPDDQSPPPDDTLPMRLAAGDLRGTATLGFACSPPPDDQNPPPDDNLNFELLIGLEGLNLVDIHPPPDDNIPAPGSSFAFSFATDQAGLGTTLYTLNFAIGSGQPYFFSDVTIGPPQSPSFLLFFGLTGLDGAYGYDPGQPLFTMAMTGDHQPVPEPATLLLMGAGLAGLAGTKIRRRK